jgi:DnaK suppressor protein
MTTVSAEDLRAPLLSKEARLLDELHAHRLQLAEPAAATENTFIAGGEGALADADDEREVALLNHAQEQLDGVRAALDRLDSGRYGDCERCAAPIGMPRLRAVPEARLCLACQQLAEMHGA